MEVASVPNSTFPTYGTAINAASNGRMSLPVSPSLVVYSQFKHVAGTPAPEGTQGVNISKLKILNTMIEQLEKMKVQNSIDLGPIDENDEKRINALIEHYHTQMKTIQNTSVYTPIAPETGVLFNIAA